MIYADYNATTPLSDGAKAWMIKSQELWGNPSSSHRYGRKALELLNNAREQVASMLAVNPNDVVFTSGGSEANTMALLGTALDFGPGFKLLTSKVEHSSIRDTLPLITKMGGTVKFLSVDPNGQINLNELREMLADFKPHLVSLMTANNETGVVFPVPQVLDLCEEHSSMLHTDAVQGLGKLDPSFYRGAHLVSISAHKIYGPKGVGALVIRKGTKLTSTHYGGSQEIKRRGGTENVIGIAGFGGAVEEFMRLERPSDLKSIRDHFESLMGRGMDGISIQGVKEPRIPNTSNIRFHGIASEVILGALDLDGIFVSAGSACSSGSISPSHVLLAMGLSEQAARECVRFSWGRSTNLNSVEEVAQTVIAHVARIRARNELKSSSH
ncbi:MAG: cysteine desulfurase [Proteobacteria bacterium]|nr:cysteine desulfurase [Pseudomonadota bacterium]NBY20256.1 cysteine desulfurase [bacterium]